MDYEKAWNDLRAVLAELQKASLLSAGGAASTMIKLMDTLEDEQKNGTKTKEVK
jgi:hypothetical protein